MSTTDTTMYDSLDQAVQHEIIEAIESTGEVTDVRAEFDVDAMTDAVIATVGEGAQLRFFCSVGEDEFWDVVAANARD